MTDKEANKKIQEMILDKNVADVDVLTFVKGDCQAFNLTPQTLGMLFEMYTKVIYDENNELSGFSREVPITELKNIHHSFESTNGCQWARSDNSYLGQRYIINRPKKSGKVAAIKLDGLNNKSIKRKRGIRKDIREKLEKESCRILDTHSMIEVDHKDGHYDVLTNQDLQTQKESDFQPLSKAANDAKRQHCIDCIRDGKRYDARKLGYKESFIVGDENTKTCAGCYWYDPRRFNEIISKDFVKEM
jgi:hypothetical protein